jgi:hypothetical protein
MSNDDYCAYWDHYFELEFDGGPKDSLLETIRLMEAVQEGERLLAEDESSS